MVNITYIDAKDQLEPMNHQAFLIEDIDKLASIHEMKEFEGKVTEEEIDRSNLRRVSVFEYMIGNSDWIIQFSKNIKFLKDDDTILVIPYDFDYTAIVNTDYSIGGGEIYLFPPQRIFKGPCFELNELQTEFDYFKGKRNELIDIISRSPYLKSGSKSEMKDYINEFFDIIDSEKKVKQYFMVNCK
jgi:hypothetical protein